MSLRLNLILCAILLIGPALAQNDVILNNDLSPPGDLNIIIEDNIAKKNWGAISEICKNYPDLEEGSKLRGIAYFESGMNEAANEPLCEATKQNPGDKEAWKYRISNLLKQDTPDRAFEVFNEMMNAIPDKAMEVVKEVPSLCDSIRQNNDTKFASSIEDLCP
jgi:tetratricopeptide (TPR) repeat protein